ncbi:MAG: DUF3539 family protein [Synechococcaceae cyanobacterium RL_1_2]|nr:DUF3539 family protein [Synechococcaceae cyanobacterium RL_1_2]
MANKEQYLQHPTFGMLFRICVIKNNQELFTTLYAQRLFFLVTMDGDKNTFQTITRADAKLLVDNRLRDLRRISLDNPEAKALQKVHNRTFY